MTTIPVVIDTDPGLGRPGSDIDDGLAIALALRSPELDVLGLTIVNGNVDAWTGTDVARNLLDRMGYSRIPVALGATAPLVREMGPLRQAFAASLPAKEGQDHPVQVGADAPRPGQRGPNTEESAAQFLTRMAAERPGEVVVIAIGPMTNLAEAIRLDPTFATNVQEFVLMAGSATTYAHNITVVGDFNSYVDPEALDIVMRSGASIRMVGLDQTARVMLSRDDASVLAQSPDSFSRWAAECTDAWIEYLGRAFPLREEHKTSCFLHDPLVIAAVTHPELLTWATAHVQVETTSELSRGLVLADRGLALIPPGAANAHVAIDTDTKAFHELFMERIQIASRKGHDATNDPFRRNQ